MQVDPTAESNPDILKARELFREINLAVAEGNMELFHQKTQELDDVPASVVAEKKT